MAKGKMGDAGVEAVARVALADGYAVADAFEDEDLEAALADDGGPWSVTCWYCCLAAVCATDGAIGLKVGPVLAEFFLANPQSPEAAALIHMKRSHGVVLFAGEDPRLALLALALFRAAILGLDAIDREDDGTKLAELVRQQAAQEAAKPVAERRKAMRKRKGVLAPSAFGKAMVGKT